MHHVFVPFCACEAEAVTLVKFGFWPSSAENPRCGFSIELLKTFHFLNMECQVSVKGFIESLRWKNSHSEGEVRKITRRYKFNLLS
jgi:hypothetical protein